MDEQKYMGGWAYVFWGIVFSIPVVGFILAIIFSFIGSNINRKKYARSFLCWALILIILVVVFVFWLAFKLSESGSTMTVIGLLNDVLVNIEQIIHTAIIQYNL